MDEGGGQHEPADSAVCFEFLDRQGKRIPDLGTGLNGADIAQILDFLLIFGVDDDMGRKLRRQGQGHVGTIIPWLVSRGGVMPAGDNDEEVIAAERAMDGLGQWLFHDRWS